MFLILFVCFTFTFHVDVAIVPIFVGNVTYKVLWPPVTRKYGGLRPRIWVSATTKCGGLWLQKSKVITVGYPKKWSAYVYHNYRNHFLPVSTGLVT